MPRGQAIRGREPRPLPPRLRHHQEPPPSALEVRDELGQPREPLSPNPGRPAGPHRSRPDLLRGGSRLPEPSRPPGIFWDNAKGVLMSAVLGQGTQLLACCRSSGCRSAGGPDELHGSRSDMAWVCESVESGLQLTGRQAPWIAGEIRGSPPRRQLDGQPGQVNATVAPGESDIYLRLPITGRTHHASRSGHYAGGADFSRVGRRRGDDRRRLSPARFPPGSSERRENREEGAATTRQACNEARSWQAAKPGAGDDGWMGRPPILGLSLQSSESELADSM